MNFRKILFFIAVTLFVSCKKIDKDMFDDNWRKKHDHSYVKENAGNFFEVGSIDIGEEGAAEISAFDPKTKKLFVVNNGTTNKIDVLDFNDPSAPVVIASI